MFNLRTVLGVFAISVLTLLIIAGWQPSTPVLEPLVLAVAKTTIGIPLWLAERQGFLAAEGLVVTMKSYPNGQEALQAVLRGEAEVATVTETPLVFAGLERLPFSIITNYASSGEHSLIARADYGIHQVIELKGRRIGIAPGTAGHYFLHVLLSDRGLSDSDVAIVSLPVTEQATALAAGRVDAVATFAPYSTQCRRILGERAWSFSENIRYPGYSSLITATGFSKRRADVTIITGD